MAIQIPKGDNLGWGMPQARRTVIQGGDDPAGRAMMGVGREMGGLAIKLNREQQQQKESQDRVNMANGMLEHEKQVNGLLKTANDKMNTGELQPDQVSSFVQSGLEKLPTTDYMPQGMSADNQERWNLNIKTVNQSAFFKGQGIEEIGVKTNAVSSINQLINNAKENNLTPDQVLEYLNSDSVKKTASLGFGIKSQEQLDNLARGYTFEYLQNQTIAASDNGDYKGLKQLREQANNKDFYKDVLQSDDRVRLAHQAKQGMKSIEAEWKAAQAERLVNLQYKIQDDSAKVEAGLDVSDPLTTEQIRAARPSNPAAAERFDRQIANYKLTMELQPVLSDVITGDPAEAQKAIEAIKPNESDDNFAFKQQRYNFVMSKYQQAVKAREADPAAWFMQNNEPVQKAYQAFTQDPSKGADFLQAVEAQKQRYGIRNDDILPKAMANNLLDKIENGKDSSIFDVQAIGAQFGSYSNQVLAQLQKNSSSAVKVVMGTEDPIAATKLYRIRHIKTAELANGFSKVTKDGIDKAIQSNFSPAISTFIRQGAGIQVINDISEQATRLAYQYVNEGMGESEAAQKAYTQLIGSQYTFNDTWRLPNKLNLDNGDIEDGAGHFKDSLKVDDISDISVYGDSRLPLGINKREALKAIKDDAQWVTSPDETGLVLTLNGLSVADKNNQPIKVPFTKLAELGMNNRSFGNRLSHWSGSSSKFEARKLTEKEKNMREGYFNSMQTLP